VQEERRLFFVALTRARDRLIVSCLAKTPRQQSAFVDNLLSDPVLAARDIEVVEASDVSPEAGGCALPGHGSGRPAHPRVNMMISEPEHRAAQGRLFDEAAETAASYLDLRAWAAQSIPWPAGERLRMSATATDDYRGCPLKYKFQHVMRIPTGPQAALTFGNLMHQSVRHYFEIRRASMPSVEELERFYDSRWQSVGFDDPYQEATYRKAGIEQLRAFVERHNAEAIGCSKIQMETSFHLSLDSVAIEGRIDQIRLLDPVEERAVEITDYKTGRPRTQKDADESLQLSVYALAAQRTLGLKPVRVAFYNLTSNETVSAVRTPDEMEEAAEIIRETAAEIRSGYFPPKPGYICRWCDYRPICPAHED
ncbi:MAG: PD-(D/E)XK nuclease family protein, partial [Terriglobia bacterium]